MNYENGMAGWQSLAQRLAECRLTAGEALRCASRLAEALRRSHDGGRVHGFLTPGAVWTNGTAVEVTAPAADSPAVTPYTAPELIAGRPAEARSDIFSFGAIFFEMLTGRPAFAGETPATLAHSLCESEPGTTGNAAADRVLAGCLAKDPTQRWPQMGAVLMELQLLSVALCKGESHPRAAEAEVPAGASVSAPEMQEEAPARHAAPGFAVQFAQPPRGYAPYFPAAPGYPMLPAEMQDTRMLSTRLQVSERSMADLHQVVAEAVTGIRGQLSTLSTQIATVHERPVLAHPAAEPALSDGSLARIEQALGNLSDRLESVERTLAMMEERVSHAEQGTEAVRNQINVLHTSIAEDFNDFEQSLQKQEKAVDSARTAMAQTDDLVERLVEALEVLQASVLDRPEEFAAAAGAGIN